MSESEVTQRGALVKGFSFLWMLLFSHIEQRRAAAAKPMTMRAIHVKV